MATCHAEVGTTEEQAGNAAPRIIVVLEDSAARERLKVALNAGGFVCVEAATGDAAVTSTVQHDPDLVLVDVGRDGGAESATKRLREWTQAPIVILGDSDDEDHKVGAFDAGADDYVTKPYGHREIIARV